MHIASRCVDQPPLVALEIITEDHVEGEGVDRWRVVVLILHPEIECIAIATVTGYIEMKTSVACIRGTGGRFDKQAPQDFPQ